MFEQCYTYFWPSAVLFSLCIKLTIYEQISTKLFYKNRKKFRQWFKKTSCHLCIDWCTVFNLTKCPFWVFKLLETNKQKLCPETLQESTELQYPSVSRTDTRVWESLLTHLKGVGYKACLQYFTLLFGISSNLLALFLQILEHIHEFTKGQLRILGKLEPTLHFKMVLNGPLNKIRSRSLLMTTGISCTYE